jgi:hypothetical protein
VGLAYAGRHRLEPAVQERSDEVFGEISHLPAEAIDEIRRHLATAVAVHEQHGDDRAVEEFVENLTITLRMRHDPAYDAELRRADREDPASGAGRSVEDMVAAARARRGA